MTRYSSISTRKLSNALKILTADKCMVAISDYNDFHKMIKRYILSNVLGPSAQVDCYSFCSPLDFCASYTLVHVNITTFNVQKRHRNNRDTLRANVSSRLHSHVKNSPHDAVNFRRVFEWELFGISLKQVSLFLLFKNYIFCNFCSLELTL